MHTNRKQTMKTATAAQLLNAVAAAQGAKGGANWIIRSSYVSASALTASQPMTYREAKARARIVIQAAGYASVERA